MKHPEGCIYFINVPCIKESRLEICVITVAEEKLCQLLGQDSCAKICYGSFFVEKLLIYVQNMLALYILYIHIGSS